MSLMALTLAVPQGKEPTTGRHPRGLDEDIYVILTGYDVDRAGNFRIYINPLINWVWIGL
jgi:cytochrome c-type biogenesis protein CcmF